MPRNRVHRPLEEIADDMAEGVDAPVRGFFSPEQIAEADAETVARTMNGMVSRINIDKEKLARKRAWAVSRSIFLLGVGVGFGIAYIVLCTYFNPLQRELSAIVNVLKSQQNH